MPHAVRFAQAILLIAAFWTALGGQAPTPQDPRSPPPLKSSQIEDLLKADHAKSIRDAAELVKLSEDLKIELEKNDRHVLSIAAIKKTEEIEKVAKRIRSRMRRF